LKKQWEFVACDVPFQDMPLRKWIHSVAGNRRVCDFSGHHACDPLRRGGFPCFWSDANEALLRVTDNEPSFARDIWLVVHRDVKSAGPVRAAMNFLVKVMKRDAAFNGGTAGN